MSFNYYVLQNDPIEGDTMFFIFISAFCITGGVRCRVCKDMSYMGNCTHSVECAPDEVGHISRQDSANT